MAIRKANSRKDELINSLNSDDPEILPEHVDTGRCILSGNQDGGREFSTPEDVALMKQAKHKRELAASSQTAGKMKRDKMVTKKRNGGIRRIPKNQHPPEVLAGASVLAPAPVPILLPVPVPPPVLALALVPAPVHGRSPTRRRTRSNTRIDYPAHLNQEEVMNYVATRARNAGATDDHH